LVYDQSSSLGLSRLCVQDKQRVADDLRHTGQHTDTQAHGQTTYDRLYY